MDRNEVWSEKGKKIKADVMVSPAMDQNYNFMKDNCVIKVMELNNHMGMEPKPKAKRDSREVMESRY